MFDMIGFDACLMGNWDTLVALQPLARLLLVSEAVEPGEGWDWGAFARALQPPQVGLAGCACSVLMVGLHHGWQEGGA
jgi:hypothetical protein